MAEELFLYLYKDNKSLIMKFSRTFIDLEPMDEYFFKINCEEFRKNQFLLLFYSVREKICTLNYADTLDLSVWIKPHEQCNEDCVYRHSFNKYNQFYCNKRDNAEAIFICTPVNRVVNIHDDRSDVLIVIDATTIHLTPESRYQVMEVETEHSCCTSLGDGEVSINVNTMSETELITTIVERMVPGESYGTVFEILSQGEHSKTCGGCCRDSLIFKKLQPGQSCLPMSFQT